MVAERLAPALGVVGQQDDDVFLGPAVVEGLDLFRLVVDLGELNGRTGPLPQVRQAAHAQEHQNAEQVTERVHSPPPDRAAGTL